MEHAKLTAIEVERAHRAGKRLLLGDGDGLYLRAIGARAVGWVEAEVQDWLAGRIEQHRAGRSCNSTPAIAPPEPAVHTARSAAPGKALNRQPADSQMFLFSSDRPSRKHLE